jgi:hypothetical protein
MEKLTPKQSEVLEMMVKENRILHQNEGTWYTDTYLSPCIKVSAKVLGNLEAKGFIYMAIQRPLKNVLYREYQPTKEAKDYFRQTEVQSELNSYYAQSMR